MKSVAEKTYRLGPFKVTRSNLIRLIATDIFVLLMILIPVFVAFAAEVILNGTFATDLSNWTSVQVVAGMTVAHDASGAANGGSVSFDTPGRNTAGHNYIYQSPSINSTDTVQLSFQWKKNYLLVSPNPHDIYVDIQKPSTTVVQIWIDSTADNSNTWNPYNQDVSSFFDENGTYQIRFGADFKNGNNAAAETWGWFDEISLDVTAGGDITPPTGVAITDPTEGQFIKGTYTLTANATDETAMDRVEFYRGGSTLIGTDNTEPEPFTFGWDTTGVTDGAYSLTAIAYDTSTNNTPSAAVNVTVDNTNPTASITDPLASQFLPGTNYGIVGTANDTNFTQYTLEYGAGASPSVWNDIGTNPRVVAVIGGTLGTWNTSALNGTYTVRLIVTDDAANSTTTTVTVNVDSTVPTATITDPTPSQLLPSTNYAVVGTADDTNFTQYTLEYGAGASPSVWNDIGTNPRVVAVIGGTLGTWDTSVLSSGTYTIRLIVTDDAANSTTDTVTVDVDSVQPTVASAAAVASTTADVLFSEDMNAATIQAGDFSIDNGLTVSAAVLQGDNRTVRLTTSSQTGGLTYTVTVSTIQDLAGNNIGAPNSAQFTGFEVDLTPPTVSITDPTDTQVIGGTYTLSANATDDIAMDRVEFYRGGSTLIGTDSTPPQPFTFGWNTTLVTEGAYSLTAVAYDTSTNNTTSTAINVTVDNTNPTATITNPIPSELIPETTYNITGTADDANFSEYTLEYEASAAPGVWNDIGANPRTTAVVAGTLGTWDTTPLNDDTYTIRLITTDDATNSTAATVTVTVDSTKPTVSSATAATFTTVDVLFSEDMDVGTINPSYFTIDNGLTVSGAVLQGDNLTVRLTTDTQTDGLTYTVTVKATAATVEDLAGNIVGLPNVAMFTGLGPDATPPTVSITDPVDTQIIAGTYTISANATDNQSMDRVEFYYDVVNLIGTDNTPPQPFTIGWDTSLVGEGTYALTAVAYDTATNSATSATVNVTVDETNPTSAITNPAPSELIPATNYSVNGTADDANFKEYWLELGVGASPLGWNDIGTNPRVVAVIGGILGTWDTSVLSDNTYTIRLTTYDQADNSTSVTVTIDVDSTAPTVVSATALSATQVDVLFDEDLDGATIQAGDFSIDNGLTVSGAVLQGDNRTVRLTTSSQTSGLTYTVTVITVQDIAGNNVGSPNTAQFTGFVVDTTPPTVSITVPLEGAFVGDIYAIDVTATDDVAIDRVEFFYDGSNQIGTDATSPYTISWDTTALSEAGHVLTATAYDTSDNNTTSTAVNVTVDNTLPTAEITNPLTSFLIGAQGITIVGSADDSVNFKEYTLHYGVGGSPSAWVDIGANPRASAVVANTLGVWDTSGLSDGVHTIRLITTDLALNSTADFVVGDVNTTAPTVVSATAVNSFQVDVLFSEDLHASASNTTYFTISDGLTVNGANLLVDGRTVRLDTDAQTDGFNYTVTVKLTPPTVMDLAGNDVVAPNTAIFSGFGGAPTSLISAPIEDQIVNGVVTITGSADDPGFSQYILEVAPGKDATSEFAELNTSVIAVTNGTLGTWDTSGESDGDYTIQLTAKNASAQETIVSVRVVVDDTPPVLDSARVVDDVTVDLLFRENVTSFNASDFSIPGLTVSNAVSLEDKRTVRLTASAQTPDNPYTVTVSTTTPALSDIGGTEIVAPNNTAGFNGFNSATIRGDGNLLRRSPDDSTCGGKTMGCHNLAVHSSDVTTNTYGTWGREFTCLTCHQPHGTPNIFLIKQTITTPNSGDKTVNLQRITGGVVGEPDFSLGDAQDGSNDSVCEVCHTQPTHFRNVDDCGGCPDETPDPNHNNDADCTSCHPHQQGFKMLGGESSGGASCDTCHAEFFTPMNSDSTKYHHYLANTDATYPVIADSTTLTDTDTNKRCLMCHVDHDIFRDDLNANSTGRANNLRETIKSTVTTSTNFTNSDYSSSHADGGICLSCHANSMTKNSTNQKDDGSTTTMAIDKTQFDNATTTHNFNATSDFSGSTFNGNCSKCHTDTLPKTRQGGSGNAFGLHVSVLNRLLAPLGIASPTSGDDPLEERLCQACHTGGASAAGQDFFSVATMSQAAINVWDMFSKTYMHPITSTSGVHSLDERATASAGWNQGATRHVECTDCHNPHGAQAGTHTVGSNIIGAALLGSWGVKPTSWGAGGASHTAFTPVDMTDTSGGTPDQFQAYLCFKCHSYFGYAGSPPNTPSGMPDGITPAAQANIADLFNPNNHAHHAVIQPGNHPTESVPLPDPQNTFDQTFVAPWGPGSTVSCSDCHTSDVSGDPAGPHGSDNRYMLRGNETGTGDAAVFCFNCHKYDVYDNGGSNPGLGRVDHPFNGNHQSTLPKIGIWCMNCHGGLVLGGIHGSNMGTGPDGGSSPLGERFLNGASITGFTAPTTANNSGGCWTKGTTDSVNNCTRGHGDQSFNANYDFP